MPFSVVSPLFFVCFCFKVKLNAEGKTFLSPFNTSSTPYYEVF
ncbi:hypothetical protein EJ73_01263 [Hoylesella shahii DSM 15611 = JCM 12083]|uniref:Uncharacterized protein n=1 Tax=Hoylesella shahii DSM 15611 = JCM 12083 TaxID=1122991 RepID=A0A318HV07_9BACT|nr:hypothetical protein EJ73_01263 [Hoylesella shahii DSM 15611 = JCM 12083]